MLELPFPSMNDRPRKRGRPKSDQKKTKENFTLSSEARSILREAAARSGLSMSAIVERCIRCQLANECMPIDPTSIREVQKRSLPNKPRNEGNNGGNDQPGDEIQ